MDIVIDESGLDINTSTYTVLLGMICTLVKSDRLMLPTMESLHTVRYYIIYTGMYRYVQVCTGVYRYVQVCTGVYRYVQVCTGMYRCVHTGVYCMNEY